MFNLKNFIPSLEDAIKIVSEIDGNELTRHFEEYRDAATKFDQDNTDTSAMDTQYLIIMDKCDAYRSHNINVAVSVIIEVQSKAQSLLV